MVDTKDQMSLIEAVGLFLQSNKEGRGEGQQELLKFARWFGRDRRLDKLTPPEVQEYAETVASGRVDSEERLKSVREFLTFARKRDLVRSNLATHLRARRPTRKAGASGRRRSPAADASLVRLTAEGHAQLKSRLEWLQEEVVKAAGEIRRAAADKDVRENAPLEAAREYHGQIMARIREDEDTMAHAQIILDDGQVRDRVAQGRRVTLRDLTTGDDLSYLVVDPREANALEGKLSTTSPVGQAILDHQEGEEIPVAAPKGTRSYLILRVE